MSLNRVYNTGESESDLKQKYNFDGSQLRKAQNRMTEMLVFLDDICKKNNITYFIAFGTLLGAVRHGGFIPWDDDLDVYIKDTDLKKLRRIINDGSYSYVVQDYTIDKGFVRYYNVLRDLRTEYVKDEFQHNQRKYRGIQIDLFPYEFGVIDSGVKLIGKTYGLNEKFFLGRHRFLTSILFYFTREFLIPVFKIISKINGNDKVALGYETGDPGYCYDTTDIFPLKTIKFEGVMVPCPNHPEAVLITDYGPNYMDLPSEKERDHHKVLNIHFYE